MSQPGQTSKKVESLVLFLDPFDPVHDEDLRCARMASLRLNADTLFVPVDSFSGFSSPQAPIQARKEMLRLALRAESSSSLQMAKFSLEKNASGSSVLCLLSLAHASYPRRKLFLLLSREFIHVLDAWEEKNDIRSLAFPISFGEPEKEEPSRVCFLNPGEAKGKVTDEDIRNLRSTALPITVRAYIESQQLYYFHVLKERESPHRLAHSISVANLAYKIALSNRYNDPGKAYVAGLVHDIAKNMSKEEALEAMKKYEPDYVSFPEWTYHQFLAKILAKELFGIQDEELLDAIGCHATGKAHMTELAKILYSSDKIEPTRGYDSSKLIAGCLRNYHNGFVAVLSANRIYLMSRGYEIDNPLTKECMDLYLGGNQK